MIEAEWEDMRRTNSPRDIFIRYTHYFQLNFDETCFLCNEGELRIIGDNNKPRHEKNHQFEVFNYSPPGWECSRCEWSINISGKGDKGSP